MSVDLLEPVGDIVKCLLLSAIVHEDNSHGSLVIGLGNRAETLLSSCVPHLKLNALLCNVNGLDFKVNAYAKLSQSELAR